MARTLELEGMSLEEVNRAFADLKSTLAPDDPKVQLKSPIHSGSETVVLNPTFIARNKEHYALKSRTWISRILLHRRSSTHG